MAATSSTNAMPSPDMALSPLYRSPDRFIRDTGLYVHPYTSPEAFYRYPEPPRAAPIAGASLTRVVVSRAPPSLSRRPIGALSFNLETLGKATADKAPVCSEATAIEIMRVNGRMEAHQRKLKKISSCFSSCCEARCEESACAKSECFRKIRSLPCCRPTFCLIASSIGRSILATMTKSVALLGLIDGATDLCQFCTTKEAAEEGSAELAQIQIDKERIFTDLQMQYGVIGRQLMSEFILHSPELNDLNNISAAMKKEFESEIRAVTVRRINKDEGNKLLAWARNIVLIQPELKPRLEARLGTSSMGISDYLEEAADVVQSNGQSSDLSDASIYYKQQRAAQAEDILREARRERADSETGHKLVRVMSGFRDHEAAYQLEKAALRKQMAAQSEQLATLSISASRSAEELSRLRKENAELRVTLDTHTALLGTELAQSPRSRLSMVKRVDLLGQVTGNLLDAMQYNRETTPQYLAAADLALRGVPRLIIGIKQPRVDPVPAAPVDPYAAP